MGTFRSGLLPAIGLAFGVALVGWGIYQLVAADFEPGGFAYASLLVGVAVVAVAVQTLRRAGLGDDEEFDIGSVQGLIGEFARSTSPAEPAWRELVGHLAAHLPPKFLRRLAAVDIDADVASLRAQLRRVFAGDPPPGDLDALWFGLFDAAPADGGEAMGYYIAGVRGFDVQNFDSLCDPAWFPEGRYLQSAALDEIKRAEIAMRRRGGPASDYLGYVGQLGAAIVLSRLAVQGLEGGRQVVVGFDSGDAIVLGPAGRFVDCVLPEQLDDLSREGAP